MDGGGGDSDSEDSSTQNFDGAGSECADAESVESDEEEAAAAAAPTPPMPRIVYDSTSSVSSAEDAHNRAPRPGTVVDLESEPPVEPAVAIGSQERVAEGKEARL